MGRVREPEWGGGTDCMWVQKRQDLQWWCDPQHWWKCCTTKHRITHPGQQRTLQWLVRTVLIALLGHGDGSKTNVICIVYCQVLNSPSSGNSNTLHLSLDLKMTFLNSAGCTWIKFSVCKWAWGHWTLWNGKIVAIYYGIMKHVHDEYYTGMSKTVKNQPNYLPPHFLHVPPTTFGHYCEIQNQVFLQSDMRSLKFSLKEKLFPHHHFLVALEISQIFYVQILFGETGGESLPASIVSSEVKHASVAYGWDIISSGDRLFHPERKRCKSKNLNFDNAHLSPIKVLENTYVCSSKGQTPLKLVARWVQLSTSSSFSSSCALTLPHRSQEMFSTSFNGCQGRVAPLAFETSFSYIRRKKMTTLD